MRLIRCNRCGVEEETPMPSPNPIFPLVAPVEAPAWAKMVVSQKAEQEGVTGRHQRVDLCEDCTEVLVEQFLRGARVEAITQPVGKVGLPHDDTLYQDCLLAFDPERGGLICEHDDPERFLKLQTDRAQNVAEGVPEQKVVQAEESVVWHLANRAIIGGHELDGNHLRALDLALSYAADQPQMFAGNEVLKGARSSVHGAILRLLRDGLAVQEAVHQMVENVETARATGAMPQRCSRECSEQHTYGPGCLLENVVQPPRPMQIQDDGEESEFPPVPGIDIPPQRGWSGDPDNE